MLMNEVYFFGCWNDSFGHYLWRINKQLNRYESIRHEHVLPWPKIDGTLTPPTLFTEQEHEGNAALHHHDGWTALAWWDRSVDKRHNSNAALFTSGTYDAATMLELGRKHFPSCMARMTYEIKVD